MDSDFSEFLKPLDSKESQVLLTNALQVADILDWILHQVGPSDIFQTTFSVSEEFLRRLFHLRKDGLVKSASLLIDHKASNKTVKLWLFISAVYERVFMADNHSKILLVQARNGKRVSVITSQNLTRGNRFESTFITTEQEVFSDLKKNFETISDYHSVPLDELLGRNIEENRGMGGNISADIRHGCHS